MASPEDDAARKKIINYFILINFVQACLAVVLLVCGFMAVHYTSGTGMFGPPYYVGAFIGGVLMILAGVVMFFIVRQPKTTDPTSTARTFFLESVACIVCCLGSFVGLIICGVNGIPECTSRTTRFNTCNYSVNISENRTVAVFILLFLVATIVACITTITVLCRVSPIFGVQRTGGQTFRIVRSPHTPAPLVIVSGAQPTAGNTNITEATTATEYQYPTVTIHGGGYGSQPQVDSDATGYGPPASTAGYQTEAGYPPTGEQRALTVAELQEQNRLLQEQIRLQQQLQQLQQSQPSGPPGQQVMTPPPPSYAECVSEDQKVYELQQQNMILQEQLNRNKFIGGDQRSRESSGVEPSAPRRDI